ncbi:hypothetical protein [uncultured Lamprocystis sp.]|jgi:hypothetical protein|uniref:hypothetical protein n=1 Tax=uncultured Lamprocystis sp. TaxID=543132 RepID=UPI0025D7ADB9|nr:hypothetical protein [uncultured Lamprocystis sp.]
MTSFPWTPQIDAKIIAARVRGELLREIAARLGISRTTLSDHLATLDGGLTKRKKRPRKSPVTGVPGVIPPPIPGGHSEVQASKDALDALRQRVGLEADAARAVRIAARRAENDARVALAHQVRMAEHRAVLTWEVLARRHVRSA